MNYLVIGNIAAGKSSLADEISKQLECEIFSIDDMRSDYSDGTFAGEFSAWAKMLDIIQHPEPSGDGVYEFSGTGKNAWFVREAIKYSKDQHDADWTVVYCLCDRAELIKRCEGRTYDVPIPYNFGAASASLTYMGTELEKKFGTGYWNAPEVTVRTDQNTPEECAAAVLG